ncbi:type IV toxin-antitoxin system AbiEi family antitoxin [Jiangella sp. DSM 45060]|uniref:type IV toxin-antitoxin system AbiEi family antitoxin n=1 Tax=Jiangella sp. DSM 45060 TaxID=1798224 RepID=UPI00087CA068|nr:type IV toxin-antitoxin system AbiEi family antitoxin [Jiangella sp. DSM 45060]SDS35778.1 hypothetical protein SAMN04515669_0914 [Jiangella sp. DSM 45060]
MADQQLRRDLLDEVVARLDELGLQATAHLHVEQDADALVTLTVDGRSHVLHAWLKPATASAAALIAKVLREIRPDGDGVVVTDYVSPTVADRLREQGAQFLDAAGNMYVRQDGVVLWVVGRPRPERAVGERPGRAFRRVGLQVVFTLLADPELIRQPYRLIALLAGTSLGAVTPVIQDLRDLGYVIGPEENRSMQRLNRLLVSWTEAYSQTLRPKLFTDRFQADDPLWWQSIDPTRYGVTWGGETAASMLTHELRPETTTIYAVSMPRDLIMNARLRRHPAGNVDVRNQFWTGGLPTPNPAVVPAPLIYADLIAAGDARSAQAAERIRETYLDRPDRA